MLLADIFSNEKDNSKHYTLTDELEHYLQFQIIFRQDKISHVSNVPDDFKFVITSNQNQILTLWDIKQKQIIRQYKIDHQKYITKLLILPDQKHFIVSQGAQSSLSDILIFQMDTNYNLPQARLQGHQCSVIHLLSTNNSKHLISIGEDFTIRFWSLESFTQIYCLYIGDLICSVEMSEDQKFVSCVSFSGWIYLFNCSNMQHVQIVFQWKFQVSSDLIIDIKLSSVFSRNSLLIITSDTNFLKIWRIEPLRGTKLIRKFRSQQTFCKFFTQLCLNDKFISNCNNSQFVLWNLQTGEIYKHKLQLVIQYIFYVLKGDKVVSVNRDNKIICYFKDSELTVLRRL